MSDFFDKIFKFAALSQNDKYAIAICALSAIFISFIIFLVRYLREIGLLRTLGLAILQGIPWIFISSGALTVLPGHKKLCVLFILFIAVIWFLTVLIITIKREDPMGAVMCFISCIFILIFALILLIPVKYLSDKLTNHLNELVSHK